MMLICLMPSLYIGSSLAPTLFLGTTSNDFHSLSHFIVSIVVTHICVALNYVSPLKVFFFFFLFCFDKGGSVVNNIQLPPYNFVFNFFEKQDSVVGPQGGHPTQPLVTQPANNP